MYIHTIMYTGVPSTIAIFKKSNVCPGPMLVSWSVKIMTTITLEIKTQTQGLIREGEIASDSEQSVVFLAAHLGHTKYSSHIRSIQGPFTISSGSMGIGGAHDKELVPYCKLAPPPPIPPAFVVGIHTYIYIYIHTSMHACMISVCVCVISTRHQLGDKSLHSHSSFRWLVCCRSLVNGFQPKYRHSRPTEINAPLPSIVIDNTVLSRWPVTTLLCKLARGSWHEMYWVDWRGNEKAPL